MAPELFNGTRVDEAADVYSLGCILYECLARKQPFGHLASEAKSFNVLFKVRMVDVHASVSVSLRSMQQNRIPVSMAVLVYCVFLTRFLLHFVLQIIVAVAINKERPPLPADTPPRLASLINRCWLEDPAQRPRVAELAAELRDMIQVRLRVGFCSAVSAVCC